MIGSTPGGGEIYVTDQDGEILDALVESLIYRARVRSSDAHSLADLIERQYYVNQRTYLPVFDQQGEDVGSRRSR